MTEHVVDRMMSRMRICLESLIVDDDHNEFSQDPRMTAYPVGILHLNRQSCKP